MRTLTEEQRTEIREVAAWPPQRPRPPEDPQATWESDRDDLSFRDDLFTFPELNAEAFAVWIKAITP